MPWSAGSPYYVDGQGVHGDRQRPVRVLKHGKHLEQPAKIEEKKMVEQLKVPPAQGRRAWLHHHERHAPVRHRREHALTWASPTARKR